VSNHAAALEDASCDVTGRGIREKNRSGKESSGRRPGDFRQKIARTRRAENGLTGAAEHCADIRALALLQQDDDYQGDADGDMNNDCSGDHLVGL